MGLDASVYCNCIETGKTKTPHPFPERLYVDSDGIPDMTETEPLEEWLLHDQWVFHQACEHERCVFLHHRIGNIASVGFLRSIIKKLFSNPTDGSPLIWDKVIYSGTHCGDFLSVEVLAPLKQELELVETQDFSILNKKEIEYLKHFLQQMNELIHAALTMKKPIVF